MERVASVVGQTPTCVQYNEYGRYTWHVISRVLTGHSGKWAEACRQAGMVPHTTHEGHGNGISHVFVTPSGNTVTLQSSYEARFGTALNGWGEFWLCHRELERPIKFTNPKGKTGYYRPDFYIPARAVYLDTKGWFRPAGRGKMKLVMACNPTLLIYLVFKPALELAETLPDYDSWFAQASNLGLFDW